MPIASCAIEAVATADGREYREGYETIDYRDLEARHLYRPSTDRVRGIDVETVPGLKIGYVMGIGDQVPLGIRQLGYTVTLLDERELATADLSQFDAIMTGTRAYAVREDLKTYNRRLLDYVEERRQPDRALQHAGARAESSSRRSPASSRQRAEEVSEEDSPLDDPRADAPVVHWPNRITKADFDGWVEQRGSKFWSTWDAAYTPIISTYDKGQAPQQGGWLWRSTAKDTTPTSPTRCTVSCPTACPGAYRMMANLLALGEDAEVGRATPILLR